MAESQQREHDDGGYGESHGDENGDGHVLFGEEEFLGEDETDAPKDDGCAYEDIGECL